MLHSSIGVRPEAISIDLTMSDISNNQSSTSSSARRRASVLRNSCDTCAASKIRCTKEKPECSKCLSRGFVCSYSVPRRPGRPAQNKLHSSSQESGSTSPNSTRSYAGHSRSDSQMQDTIGVLRCGGKNTARLSGVLGSTGIQLSESSSTRASPSLNAQSVTEMPSNDNEPWPTGTGLSSEEMEELFNLDCFNQNFTTLDVGENLFSGMGVEKAQTSSSADCLAATASLEHAGDPGFSPFRFDSTGSLPVHSMVQSDNMSSTATSSGATTRTQSSDSGLSTLHRSLTNDDLASVRSLGQQMGSCSCQARALDLMILPTPSQTSQGRSNAGEAPSFESVLDLNATVTEAMWQILQCPCTKDAYQLVVLALSTCKTLEWFDAAASSVQLVAPPTASIGGMASTGQDASRTAAQIVLSRLPSVQRVVDTLSDQLHLLFQGQEIGEAEGMNGITFDTSSHHFFSADLARSLEMKLRRRTREMARRVIAQLR